MSAKTPEDRSGTVERHVYTINALAEVIGCASTHAHLTERADLGFLLGFMATLIHQEADAVLAAVSCEREARS
ncbi:hypothetical protein ACW7BJ_33465 [Azospirillum argentinense]